MALTCGPKSSVEGGWRSRDAFHPCTAPLPAPTATMQRCVSASAVQKYPPMNSVVSRSASALTRSLRLTCHGVGTPLARSTAATYERGCPATKANHPPTYKVGPLGARAVTRLLMSHLHGSGTLLDGLSATRCARGSPATKLKSPPTYTVPPTGAIAHTCWSGSGAQAATLPSARIWARLARGCSPT